MKMVKRKHPKLQEQDETRSDEDDDQNKLHQHSTTQVTFQSKPREAHEAKWLNYKHFGLVSSSSANFVSKQDLERRVMRSTGRKDRHSKICTAKGPRDRRVRLAANTAIQFYDVQDRLGYDRPSEAIEWLMKEAKVAIDDLQALPHETEQETEYQFSNEKEDPFMGLLVPSPSSDLHYLLQNTNSKKPRSENQAFGHNPVQFSLFSGSNSLDSEATFTNWSLPQTLELRNGDFRDGSFDVGSGPSWLQAVSGGTLQSSYYYPPSLGNPDYSNIPALGPCLGTTNLSTNGGFSVSGVQGEEEKQSLFPNKPSSGSFLLNFQD